MALCQAIPEPILNKTFDAIDGWFKEARYKTNFHIVQHFP